MPGSDPSGARRGDIVGRIRRKRPRWTSSAPSPSAKITAHREAKGYGCAPLNDEELRGADVQVR